MRSQRCLTLARQSRKRPAADTARLRSSWCCAPRSLKLTRLHRLTPRNHLNGQICDRLFVCEGASLLDAFVEAEPTMRLDVLRRWQACAQCVQLLRKSGCQRIAAAATLALLTRSEVKSINVLSDDGDAFCAHRDLRQGPMRGIWSAAIASFHCREHVLRQPEIVPPSTRILLEFGASAPLEQRAFPNGVGCACIVTQLKTATRERT